MIYLLDKYREYSKCGVVHPTATWGWQRVTNNNEIKKKIKENDIIDYYLIHAVQFSDKTDWRHYGLCETHNLFAVFVKGGFNK